MDKLVNNNKRIFDLNSYERARIVSTFTCIFSLIYHSCAFIAFLILQVTPMFLYNIFSILVFTTILLFIPRVKSFVFLYFLAVLEVVLHQLLGDYFLGTQSAFHFFILLMGLLPFLVFEGKFYYSIPITLITSFLFVNLENSYTPAKIDISPSVILAIRYVNILLTIMILLFMVLIYTIFVFEIEKHLKKSNDMMAKELRLASNIQQNFFKQDTSGLENWDLGICLQPMAGVSGDFYDMFRTGNKLDGFGIFDVSGHGVASGLVSMLVKNIIHQDFYADREKELWEIVLGINDRVIEEKGDIENYLTGILVRMVDNETLEFVNASHPVPLIYRKATNKIEVIERKSNALGAIGIRDFPTFYETQTVKLEDGDALLLYTDGATDCKDANGVEFGLEKLKEEWKNLINFDASEQMYLLLTAINDYRGSEEPNDDITLIVIKKK